MYHGVTIHDRGMLISGRVFALEDPPPILLQLITVYGEMQSSIGLISHSIGWEHVDDTELGQLMCTLHLYGFIVTFLF